MKGFAVMVTICTLLLAWYVVIPTLELLDKFSLTPKVNPAPVCGRLSGAVIEVPSQYLFFWAEYEGKSSWEIGFTENKKGCDANLVSLTLDMLWPSMKPYPKLEYGPDRTHGHVTVHLGSADRIYFKWYLSHLLSGEKSLSRNAKEFDKVLNLHYVLNTRLHEASESKNVYWAKEDGEISTIIECTTFDTVGVYGCEQTWFLSQYKASVRLSYATDFLTHWAAMQIDVNNFIVSHFKNKEVKYAE